MKKRNLIVMFLFVIGIISITVGVSVAIFNYTRTGNANVLSVGRINFASSESGNLNLTNAFPVTRENALSDSTNSSEVTITIMGDTSYTQGIEYLVTLEDVSISTSTNKKIPVGIIVAAEKTGELGTNDSSYFTNRGGNTSIYKSFIGNDDVIEEGQYVLVGYIRPGEAEVNGTIGIRAFIDADKIAVSNTYDGTELGEMGTTTNWVNGRVVLTTTEWNSLNSTGISFKVNVQANEGIWVGEPTSRNDMGNMTTANIFTNAQKSDITEINFIRMSEEMINIHSDLIDLSAGQGMVKAWIDGTKLYIASPGDTYFPVDSSNLLSGFPNVTKINFNNVNTSLVSNMTALFNGDSSLANIDLSSFDTSNVTNMPGMFSGCSSLTSLNLSGLGSDKLTNIQGVFNGCTNLINIDMSNFNFGNITSLNGNYSPFYGLTNVETINLNNANTSNVTGMVNMFSELTNLENLYLANINTSNVTQMMGMFQNCSNLKVLDLSGFDTSKLVDYGMSSMFSGCSSLKTIYVSDLWNSSTQGQYSIFSGNTALVGGNGTRFDSDKVGKTMAVIDTLSTPGYLTEKKASYSVNAMGYFPSYIINVRSSITKVIFTRMSESDMYARYYAAGTRADITYNNEGKVLTWIENNILYVVSDGITYLTNGNGGDNYGLFGGFNNVETYIFNNIDTSRVTNMRNMFSLNEKITNLDLSKFNTSNVTDMSFMFYFCNTLTSLDLSSFNTSKVTTMSNMFLYCYALATINLSSFDTSNVTAMDYMFSGCRELTSLNITHFNTGKVTKMHYMFRNCKKLSVIDISGFGNSNLDNINYMFEGCERLNAIYMNNFNFGNVAISTLFTNISSTTLEAIYLNNAILPSDSSNMFSGLSSLHTIYLNNVNVSNVTNTVNMFSGCTSLTTIYVSNSWNGSGFINSEDMFSNCTSLVGGNGTTYDSTKTDKSMAVIDTVGTPGYLTLAN